MLFEHSVKVDMILKQVNRELGEYIFCFFLFGWWWWFFGVVWPLLGQYIIEGEDLDWSFYVCAGTWLYNYAIVVNLGQRFCFFVVKFKFFSFLLGTKILWQKKLNANSNDEMRSLMGNGDFLFYRWQAVFTHDTNDETLCAVFGFGELWDKCFFGWERVCVCRCMCWISTNL